MSIEQSQNEQQINYPHPYVYQSWIVDQDRSNLFWDNWPSMHIIAIFSQKYKISKSFSGVTPPIVTVFAHDVVTFNALLTCPLAFRYSSPFQNGNGQKMPTLISCYGNVP